MNDFAIGQRWLSETETDLGLGIIQSIDYRLVTIYFPASDEERTYAKDNAPLSRVKFGVGDDIANEAGESFKVLAVESHADVLFYQVAVGEDEYTAIPETQLTHTLQLKQAEERLFSRQIDSPSWFELRHASLQALESIQRQQSLGLNGPRVDLIPHQLYIANEIAKRYAPRVLLADEVGLGKTIEAGLIIHQQLISQRAERVLIVVPKALTHQWFVEMYRRFNLHFNIFDQERMQALQESGEEDIFATQHLVLCSLDFVVNEENRQILDAEWDLLVVDEAHHLDWQVDSASKEYLAIEGIANNAKGVLLLTATPEQLGQEGHFARLRLLDPDRFHSLDQFVKEQQDFQPIADLVSEIDAADSVDQATLDRAKPYLSEETFKEGDKETLIRELLDNSGTGRVLFRNTRKNIKGFPKRKVIPYPLSHEGETVASDLLSSLHPEAKYEDDSWCQSDVRVDWLHNFLKQNPNEKILVICAMKDTAMDLELFLRYRKGFKTAVFHEDMDLISRDRAAAYFADHEDGAQILVCSEIGSEGRNFQFASNLVLFDLPLIPDLLEQRIGRLDRIGQQQDIKIHVPFIAGSAQETLFDWYHQGINAFEQTNPAGEAIYLSCENDLLDALSDTKDEGLKKALLEKTKKLTAELRSQLETGRDRLLELASYKDDEAKALVEQIAANDLSNPYDFMERVFDRLGVVSDEHSAGCNVLTPGDHMFIPSFPFVPEDGVTVTYDRETALSREDMVFLSWEHPMINSAIDIVLSQEKGKACVCLLKNKGIKEGTLLVEALYKVEAIAPKEMQIQRFLPVSLVRVLVDPNGRDLSGAVSHENICKQTHKLQKHIGRKILSSQESVVRKMMGASLGFAKKQSDALVVEAKENMDNMLGLELSRLQALQRRNANIRDEEIAFLESQKEQLGELIQGTRCQLEAVRLIITSQD